MLPRTHRAMLAAVLPLLVLVILAYVPSAAVANHVTCSWTGPGNDPEPAGWINTCVAKKQSDDGETAIYVGYFEHGHSTVADFGKLRPNKDGRGRLEFHTPCNGGRWAPNSMCKRPHWFGLCLGDAAPYTKCLYMDSNDDCEWPDTFEVGEKPTQVTIWRTEHGALLNATLESQQNLIANAATAGGSLTQAQVESAASEHSVARELHSDSTEEFDPSARDATTEDGNTKRILAIKARSFWSKDAADAREKRAPSASKRVATNAVSGPGGAAVTEPHSLSVEDGVGAAKGEEQPESREVEATKAA